MKRFTRGISFFLMVILVVGLQGRFSEAVPSLTRNLSFSPAKVYPHPYRATWLETVWVTLPWNSIRLLDMHDVKVTVANCDAMTTVNCDAITTVDPLSNTVSFVLPKHIWGGPQQFSISGIPKQTNLSLTLAQGIINVLGESVFDARDNPTIEDPTKNVPTTSIFFISKLLPKGLQEKFKLKPDLELVSETHIPLGGPTTDDSPCRYTLYEAKSSSNSLTKVKLSVGQEIEALEATNTVVDAKGVLAADPRPGQSLDPEDGNYFLSQENASSIDAKLIVGGGNISSEDTTIAILDSGISEALATDPRYHVLSESTSFLTGVDGQAYGDSFINVGHGTAVAALASSISPSSKILSIKVCDSNNKCPLTSVVQGICYAINFAKSNPKTQMILNLSLGSETPSMIIYAILKDAMSSPRFRGATKYGQPLLLVTAASGNEWDKRTKNAGTLFHYPAAFAGMKGLSTKKSSNETIPSLTDLISVGAVGQSSEGRLLAATFSNQGDYISLAAPGINVMSRLPDVGNRTGIFTGTSFATPIVSGALALMSHSRIPATETAPATGSVIKAELLRHVRPLPGIAPAAVKDVIGAGLLDLRR